MVLLSQFCPSVCLSKWCTQNILIPHERAITLVSDTSSGWWATPPSLWNLRWPAPFEKRRLRQISADNVSTARESENIQLWRIGNLSRAFQRAIDGVCVNNLSPQRMAQKPIFQFFGIKFNLNRIKSAIQSFVVWKLPAAKL